MLSLPVMPRAMFGGLLWGDNAVRFIFMDEAGTDEMAPVRVVIGINVHADKQLLRAESAIDEALLSVPARFKEGFKFSAKNVWNNPEYKKYWSQADRLAFLRSIMSLPGRMKLPVTVSMVRRGGLSSIPTPGKMKPHQFEHFIAFANCIARADKYIRENAEVDEIGTVVAEQASDMTKYLRQGARIYRDNPGLFPSAELNLTEEEKKLGYIKQESEMRVSRIRPTIHFVDKEEEQIVFLADAYAFAFRRFFAGEDFGEMFVREFIGADFNANDWSGPSNIGMLASWR